MPPEVVILPLLWSDLEDRGETASGGTKVGCLPFIDTGSSQQPFSSVGIQANVDLSGRHRVVNPHISLPCGNECLRDVIVFKNGVENTPGELITPVNALAAMSRNRL